MILNSFNLQIVTPDGLFYDGTAEKIIVTTVDGDVGILAYHANYLAPIGIGKAVIFADGKARNAACTGGMISMTNNFARLVCSTFEWAEDIDVDRARRASQKANDRIVSKTSDAELKLAELKLKRALNRIKIYENK